MNKERIEALGKQASQMVEKMFPDEVKMAILDMPIEERMVFWGLVLSYIGGALVRCADDDPQLTKSIWDMVGAEIVALAHRTKG